MARSLKIIQINTTVNTGSTGRIAEDIGKLILVNEHESYIAAGFTDRPSTSQVIRIGNAWDIKFHGLKTRLFDRHGFGSKNATIQLVQKIVQISPDIIHLHNLHGYYLHIGVLFDYLKEIQKPVIWTFHDCWPFTGHCSHFDRINCYKWQKGCYSCPLYTAYPGSWWLDQSTANYNDKNEIFNGVKGLSIVTPSVWLSNHVKNSFLGNYSVKCIHNGVDLNVFLPSAPSKSILKKYKINTTPFILGVASIWSFRKGLKDFEDLAQLNDGSFQIVLVGLSKKQIKSLPLGIVGIERTENTQELASLYAASNVFVNPTYVDNFPTTNIEALACGTPVITYNTGGSPEAIDIATGIVLEKGDLNGLVKAIMQICNNGKDYYSAKCRERAVLLFNKDDRYNDYLAMYKQLL